MSKRLRFEKWEKLSNDFVVLTASPELDVRPELARMLCDRRRGIGADGVLLVDARDRAARPRMVVLNADGSRPEMCGNGLRCVAAYLADAGWPADLTVETDAGPRRCQVSASRGGVEVTIEMGRARTGEPLEVVLDGATHRFAQVDVGNPHAITFAPFDEPLVDRLGPVVAGAVPGGTNVEFCRMVDGPVTQPVGIEVVVWERGVGRTLACGTGACAVAAAACAEGRARYDVPLPIRLPGGELEVTVARDQALRMRGPARRAFSGELEVP